MEDRVLCRDCKFFIGMANIQGHSYNYGECHLHPPKKSYTFIEVYKDDWCGQGLPKDDDE